MSPKIDKSIALYMGKCAASCVLAYGLSLLLPGHDLSWFLISIVLVLSPDSAESIPLAVIRIKANLLGALASIAIAMLTLPPLFGLAIALMLTVLLCHYFNVMSGSRPALAAVIIILLHPHENGTPWDIVLLRLAAVIAGCVAGLAITALFHGTYWQRKTSSTPNNME